MKRLLTFILMLTMVFASQAAQFSKAEKAEINTLIHDYLLKNPQILIQMSQELQQQQYTQLQQQAFKAIKANSAQLFSTDGTQPAGNPNGKVTLVAFFDYQCVHCANLQKQKVIANLIANNSNLRVIYREFPIFGAPSTYAAKAALAAAKQGKYLAMYNAIFDTGAIEGNLTPADVDKAAQKAGLNMNQYRTDLKQDDAQFSAYISTSFDLAKALGIQGTPSFVIAPTPKTGNPNGKTAFIPGLVSAEQLQQAVDAAK